MGNGNAGGKIETQEEGIIIYDNRDSQYFLIWG